MVSPARGWMMVSPTESGKGFADSPAENGAGFAGQRPAHELRGRSIAMGLIGPIAIRPRQFDALVVPPGRVSSRWRAEGCVTHNRPIRIDDSGWKEMIAETVDGLAWGDEGALGSVDRVDSPTPPPEPDERSLNRQHCSAQPGPCSAKPRTTASRARLRPPQKAERVQPGPWAIGPGRAGQLRAVPPGMTTRPG